MNRFIVGPIYDLFLICFPIWVPLSYYILSTYFSINNSLLFFLYLFVLGETHFGATWLFFIFSSNRKWALSNKYYSIYLPLLIIISLIVLAFNSIEAVLLLILLFNIFHVSRQSIGIIKIYSTGIDSINFELLFVYMLNVICGLIGIFRFIIPINIIINNLFYISVVFISIPLLYFIYLIFFHLKNTNFYFISSVMSGSLLFLPFLFANTIQDAFAMGVGMHYSQYLALVLPITLRRINSENQIINSKSKLYNKTILVKILLYLFCYSAVMVSLTFSKIYVNYIYLLPVLFQLSHFYIEGYIWRFSNVYLRNNVGKYLFVT